jgi:hypothetical protein
MTKVHVVLAAVILVCLAATAGAFTVNPIQPPLPETSVKATLVFMGGEPGSQLYRYEFEVRNISVPPAIQTVLVFFDSDPVTGEFLGDRADLVEIQSPTNWEGYGWVDPDPSPWYVEWMTFSGPDRIFPGQTKTGFAVTFLWKDPNSVPGSRFFEAMNGVVYEGQTIPVGMIDESGSVCGTVFDECATGDPPPVTVDLLDENGVFQATTSTDETGHYCFMELLPGTYTVSIVTPLGFIVDAETKTVTVNPSEEAQVDFWLSCLDIEPEQRTIGYWKHQVNALVMGKGKPHETMESMVAYLHAIREHFNENIYNPVIVLDFEIDPETATGADSLLAVRQLLTVNKGGTMLDRARQQMTALLLNVASLKLSQAEIISEDGANVSQAITYCNAIITGQVPGVSYEVAKDIADIINNGRMVAAGVIPLDTVVIWYSLGRELVQIVNLQPNPFSSAVSVRYVVPDSRQSDTPACLEVFDIRGRMIYSLDNLDSTPGEHQVFWSGIDTSGRKVASGAYFMCVKSDGGTSSRKVMLIRSE